MSDPSTDLVRIGSEVVRDPRVQQTIEASIGAPAREAGAWLADHIRFRRFQSQLRIWVGATEQLARANIDPGRVDLSVLVPLIESGSLQENGDMLDRWAKLLATASAANAVPPAFPEILRQLEPVEAQLLDRLIAARSLGNRARLIDLELEALGGYDAIEFRHLDNLERLGLLQYSLDLPANVLPDTPASTPGDVLLADTPLGRAFVRACEGPLPAP